jgi:hypothetical protein
VKFIRLQICQAGLSRIARRTPLQPLQLLPKRPPTTRHPAHSTRMSWPVCRLWPTNSGRTTRR